MDAQLRAHIRPIDSAVIFGGLQGGPQLFPNDAEGSQSPEQLCVSRTRQGCRGKAQKHDTTCRVFCHVKTQKNVAFHIASNVGKQISLINRNKRIDLFLLNFLLLQITSAPKGRSLHFFQALIMPKALSPSDCESQNSVIPA